MELRLSSYGAASSHPSPVSEMMAAFATGFRDGVDINLGVGYVNEHTIPGPLLVQAMERVMAQPGKYRQAWNYGGPHGSPNLIEAIRDLYRSRHAGQMDEAALDRQQIIIGPSGATSLLEAIGDVLEPGLVITADPMYYIYCNTLERKGFQVVTIPEDEHGLDAVGLQAKLDELGDAARNIAFIYIVTVNNPTCTILSNTRRRELTEVVSGLSRAQQRHIPLFFDLAYELLIHDPAVEAPGSGLAFDELGIVYEIGTLSKILAPALRVGYLMGRPGPLLDALVQKTSDVGFSAPLIMQEVAAYMLEAHLAGQLERVNAGYRRKAIEVRRAIDAQLGGLLSEVRGGSAGFYYYLTFHDIETHTTSPLFRFLTRSTGDPAVDGPPDARHARVIYIPGEYCVHPKGAMVAVGRRQLRLSYGFEESETIVRAVGIMREAAEYARG